MFKRDPKAKFAFQWVGVFHKRRQIRFQTGNMHWSWMEESDYDSIQATQEHRPIAIAKDSSTNKRWWWFKEKFYCEDEGYTPSQVAALILDKIAQEEKKVQRAVARLSQSASPPLRQPIPDDVRILVWQRDGGRCVKCGRRENLEYDHIIPLAKGGSNTARNLQLLCEICNRSKGSNLY